MNDELRQKNCFCLNSSLILSYESCAIEQFHKKVILRITVSQMLAETFGVSNAIFFPLFC